MQSLQLDYRSVERRSFYARQFLVSFQGTGLAHKLNATVGRQFIEVLMEYKIKFEIAMGNRRVIAFVGTVHPVSEQIRKGYYSCLNIEKAIRLQIRRKKL